MLCCGEEQFSYLRLKNHNPRSVPNLLAQTSTLPNHFLFFTNQSKLLVGLPLVKKLWKPNVCISLLPQIVWQCPSLLCFEIPVFFHLIWLLGYPVLSDQIRRDSGKGKWLDNPALTEAIEIPVLTWMGFLKRTGKGTATEMYLATSAPWVAAVHKVVSVAVAVIFMSSLQPHLGAWDLCPGHSYL